MRSKQKTPHLWENMEQQNHRQETVLNLNESQQWVSANGKENVGCAVFTKDMCQSLSIAYRGFHLLSPSAFAAPMQLKFRSSPPTLFFHNMSYVIYSISLNWFTGPAGSAHPQFIPTLFKIREVLGEGQDINRCTCANGVPADLWQRL